MGEEGNNNIEDMHFSGVGRTVYIGKVMEDGSLPKVENLTPIEVDDAPAFNSEEHKDENKGFSASFTVSFKESDEDKEKRETEEKLIDILMKAGVEYSDMIIRYITQHRCHGRRRKALWRGVVRNLKARKDVVNTAKYCTFKKIDALVRLESMLNGARLNIGKTVTAMIGSPDDPFKAQKVRLKQHGKHKVRIYEPPTK